MTSAYTKSNETFIESLQASYLEYTHKKTGACIIHIKNEDPENIFSITVPTHTHDSMGTPHILEHTILCGSKKFPVKDPFFSMIRRSLNTYLNASTASDYTCYPAGSMIEKDFYNLLEVYLDAVFYPNLTKESFLQEGHRLEFEKFDDKSTPLEVKGIVYNEMKGAMASPHERLWYQTMEHLYPGLPYGFNHGGIPDQVKELPHQTLLEFHKKFYHPTHTLFYFYGNLDTEKHLKFLDKHLLNDFSQETPLPKIPKLKRFEKKKSVQSLYPVADLSNQAKYLSVSWALNFTTDNIEDILTMLIIDELLMGSDAALLKRAILESKLCHQVSTAFEKEFSEPCFMISFQGDQKMQADKLLSLLDAELKKLIQTQFSEKQIESAMHQVTVAHKEISRDFYPYGLQLMSRGALLKLYGGDPIAALEIDSSLKKIKSSLLNDKNFIGAFIEKNLLLNKHRVDFELSPSIDEKNREMKAEKDYLDKLEKSLSDADKDQILNQAKALREYQDAEEDLNVLPKLNLEDVPKEVRDYPIETLSKDSFDLHTHSTFTNGFVYWDFFVPLAQIDQELWPWLALYAQMLTEVGSSKRSFAENLEYTQKYISSFECSPYSIHNPFKKSNEAFFNIQISALEENSDKALSLVLDTLKSPNFSELDRLDELLTQVNTYLETSLVEHAYSYAKLDAAKHISNEAFYDDVSNGYTFYKWMHELYHSKPSPKLIKEKLSEVHSKIFLRKKMQVTLCSSKAFLKAHQDQIQAQCNDIAASIPSVDASPFTLPDLKPSENHRSAYCIGAPVAFTQACFKTLPYTDKDSPYQPVTANLLKNKTLHKRIREQGGAYGSGASSALSWECIFFSSYRDPHFKRTLKAFSDSLEETSTHTDTELEEAILNTLTAMEAPLTPEHRAVLSFNYLVAEKTKDVRTEWKKGVLQTKKEDIMQFIDKWLKPKMSSANITSFADEGFFKQEGAEEDGFEIIKS